MTERKAPEFFNRPNAPHPEERAPLGLRLEGRGVQDAEASGALETLVLRDASPRGDAPQDEGIVGAARGRKPWVPMRHPSTVIPRLDPGIHALGSGVDGRDKPGHDGEKGA
ncbi:hypothetical protein GCM10007036_02960 [Alsobacter metallidurans]|uniref:Uncharacterized protein n=1 Tax=Alsobacter metallidurans TaxID=340221 RepID=A0A917I491_9HYPH|nr:hypothetical protein GCM10007036_02960 [Alsobacter metallidurans]